MIISTQTEAFAAKFGEHDAIKLLAKVGFDALDYSMFGICDKKHPINKEDYKEYAKSLKKTADEYNIVFNQVHAPFPSYVPDPKKEEYNENIVFYIIRAMEVASIIGGKIIIVHPITLPNQSRQIQKEFNINFYNKLLPYCKKFNVKIALENMWGWDEAAKKVTPAACSTAYEFTDYLDTLNSLDSSGGDWFVACLDVGHGEMQGTGAQSAVEFINTLGHNRLKSLHVHDNDKIGDLHTLPFTQKINWGEILNGLKSINYDGEFTFEADNFLMKFPQELYLSASALMLDVGRYLVGKYEL